MSFFALTNQCQSPGTLKNNVKLFIGRYLVESTGKQFIQCTWDKMNTAPLIQTQFSPVPYRADADAGVGLALAVWGGAGGGGRASGGWQSDEPDALSESLLLFLQVAEQLSLSLSRQLGEQRVLRQLLLQGQRLGWHRLSKDTHRIRNITTNCYELRNGLLKSRRTRHCFAWCDVKDAPQTLQFENRSLIGFA